MPKSHRLPTLIVITLLSACAGQAPPIPEAGTEGARMFSARCQACHALPHPRRLTAGQWDHMLGVMRQRMRERGLPDLAPEELDTIRDYLHRHARS